MNLAPTAPFKHIIKLHPSRDKSVCGVCHAAKLKIARYGRFRGVQGPCAIRRRRHSRVCLAFGDSAESVDVYTGLAVATNEQAPSETPVEPDDL